MKFLILLFSLLAITFNDASAQQRRLDNTDTVHQELICGNNSTWGEGKFYVVLIPYSGKMEEASGGRWIRPSRTIIYNSRNKLIGIATWTHWPYGPHRLFVVGKVPLFTNSPEIMVNAIYSGCEMTDERIYGK